MALVVFYFVCLVTCRAPNQSRTNFFCHVFQNNKNSSSHEAQFAVVSKYGFHLPAKTYIIYSGSSDSIHFDNVVGGLNTIPEFFFVPTWKIPIMKITVVLPMENDIETVG